MQIFSAPTPLPRDANAPEAEEALWKPKSTTMYSLMTGLAISKDSGKSFKRFSKAPILKLTDKEPYSILTAPYVLKKGNRWLMWYVSCNEWKNENFPLYDIKFASSKDGLNWSQDGKVSIKLKKGESTTFKHRIIVASRALNKGNLNQKFAEFSAQ